LPPLDLPDSNSDHATKSDRISGKKRTQFPEPTKGQADECGAETQKLYALGYRQLSAYVHGSAWALRRQAAYIRTGYDETVVMIDFANLTRILLAVWVEWLKIMSEELGWQALGRAHGIVERCNELDEATMDIVARMRTQEAGSGEPQATASPPRCVLCDEAAGEGSKRFRLTPKAGEYFKQQYPDVDVEEALSRNVLCPKCQRLPRSDRQKMVRKAIARELKSYRGSLLEQVAQGRVRHVQFRTAGRLHDGARDVQLGKEKQGGSRSPRKSK
jgi:hypothetical protein